MLSRKQVLSVIIGLSSLATTDAFAKSEKVCGWFDNPSASNATLTDRDGSWEIASQGGFQAKGDWPAFDFDEESNFVRTGNGSYGYGCACIHGTKDKKKKRILEIHKTMGQKLSFCRKDKKLKEPVNPLDDTDENH